MIRLLFSCLLFINVFKVFSQVYNQGNILLLSGTTMYIEQNLTNQQNGSIDNSGTILLIGNLENNNNSNQLFINSSPGTVRFIGNNQNIGGTNSTKFYNLSIEGTGIKTMTINSEVEGILNLNDRELATNQYVMQVSNSSVNAISFTTGFVSSLGNGYLSRTLNSTQSYIFPVGSSLGTPRYRPVELIPTNNNQQVMGVRMANTDATNESYDRNITDGTVGNINSLFFHKIERVSGNTANNVAIYYDATADGAFSGIAHWNDTPFAQWTSTVTATQTSGTPLSSLTINNWNDYTYSPFALYGCTPSTEPQSIQASATTICGNEVVTLTVVGGSLGTGAQWTWYEGQCGGTPIGTGTSIQVQPASTTTYFVNATGTCGTTQCVSLTILVGTIPSIEFTTNSPVCQGQTILISVTAAGATQYSWSGPNNFSSLQPNITIPNATLSNAGNYTVTVTNNVGCTNTAIASVQVNELPTIAATYSGATCEGNSISLQASPSGMLSYEWSGPNNFNSTQQNPVLSNVTESMSGTYTVAVSHSCGTSSATVQVVVYSNPEITFTIQHESCKNMKDGQIITTVQGTEPISYVWTNNITQPNLTSLGEGTYSLTVYDANGCSATKSAIINKGEHDCFFVPTIFSPNGDGNNDVLYVRAHGVKEMLFRIYDRWGNIIFESTSINIGWDGSYNGKPMNTGAYAYHLKLTFLNNTEKEIRSNVTLIR